MTLNVPSSSTTEASVALQWFHTSTYVIGLPVDALSSSFMLVVIWRYAP